MEASMTIERAAEYLDVSQTLLDTLQSGDYETARDLLRRREQLRFELGRALEGAPPLNSLMGLLGRVETIDYELARLIRKERDRLGEQIALLRRYDPAQRRPSKSMVLDHQG